MEDFTQEQYDALRRLFEHNPDGADSYEQFVSRATYSPMMGCVMVPWRGMTIGIEADGYTHS